MTKTPVLAVEQLVLPDEMFMDTSLDLPEGVTFEQWETLGDNMQKFEKSHQWWLGDWIYYGNDAFGEKSAQAIHVDGVAPATIANYAWVSSRIARKDRNYEGLKWSHYAAVSGLDKVGDRRKFLKQASAEDMSVANLAKLVKQHKAIETGEAPEDNEPEDEASSVKTFTVSWSVPRGSKDQGAKLQEAMKALVEEQFELAGLDSSRISTSSK